MSRKSGFLRFLTDHQKCAEIAAQTALYGAVRVEDIRVAAGADIGESDVLGQDTRRKQRISAGSLEIQLILVRILLI